MALANFGVKKLEEFIFAGSYYVPDYQRDYAWEKNVEVKELWDDIISVYQDGLKEYFLGQTVIHFENNKKYLIDGQQRMTTLFLLLLSINNVLKNVSSDDNYSKDIKTKADKNNRKLESLLSIIDREDEAEKLFLGENDKEFFRDLIYTDFDLILKLKEKKISRKKLVEAYKFFSERLNDIIANSSNKEDGVLEIIGIYETVCNSLKLLYVETNDESEAFMIFETLNARGRDLETSDLLKNYLFRVGINKIDTIKNNWNKMAEKFESYSITNFIRCIWNSQFDFCREKMLYKKLTEEFKNPKRCLELSELLKNSSDIYLALLDPKNNHYFQTSQYKLGIEEIIESLSILGHRSYFPVVIAYFNHYKNEDDFEKNIYSILKAIQTLIVRDLIICKSNPNKYEIAFSGLAKKITDMSVIDVADIVKRISDESVDDATFETNFLIYSEKGTKSGKDKIRHILRTIINYKAKAMKVKSNNNVVHIEHIMPQNISKWGISKDVHEDNLWKLGNLTLIDFEMNESIKNEIFDIKKAEYAKSDINLTSELTQFDSWDENSILQRQQQLLVYAKKIWSF